MRLCRFTHNGQTHAGFFFDHSVISLATAAELTGQTAPKTEQLISLLPGGAERAATVALQNALAAVPADQVASTKLAVDDVQLLVPIANPSKLLLLAGNYAKHIEEGGARAEERAKTFPYVFMKPPQTTLTNPGDPIRIPAVSPDHVDWELELGVVIGKRCKNATEANALSFVAGYTVVNDISDRKFKPNPGRNAREKDGFFDWLHGKWHDTFCPMGPCILPADECPDPQALHMTLTVNDTVEQDGSTSEMVFPVAAIVQFISSFVTLEPGDIISTGTTSGVGSAKGKFLKAGDTVTAFIDSIGVLRNPVE